uniref:MICAL-like protein 1 n=1 Tax=Timema shepardi TaxID=629360 RepID=A0A7R9AUN1_TIMSH|nr:unnamed protein product [Timema shepardi]
MAVTTCCKLVTQFSQLPMVIFPIMASEQQENIKFAQLKMGEKRGMKGLETWCKRVTSGYPGVKVENMTTSWRDGLAFCALIHHFRPDLLDFASLDKDDIYRNNTLAFRLADQYLGIPALLDAEDMVEYAVPDRLSILTYLAQFYQTLGHQGSSPARAVAKRPASLSDRSTPPLDVDSPPTKVLFLGGPQIVEVWPSFPGSGGLQCSGGEIKLVALYSLQKYLLLEYTHKELRIGPTSLIHGFSLRGDPLPVSELCDPPHFGGMSQVPTRVLPLGRREPCAKCGLPVFIAERFLVNGRTLYHRTCFRCARCQNQLSLANYYETEDGRFCCETCPDEVSVNADIDKCIGTPLKFFQSQIVEQQIESQSVSSENDDYSTSFETALEESSFINSLSSGDTPSVKPASSMSRAMSSFMSSQLISDTEHNISDSDSSKPLISSAHYENSQNVEVVSVDDDDNISDTHKLVHINDKLELEVLSIPSASALDSNNDVPHFVHVDNIKSSDNILIPTANEMHSEPLLKAKHTKESEESSSLSIVQKRLKMFENNSVDVGVVNRASKMNDTHNLFSHKSTDKDKYLNISFLSNAASKIRGNNLTEDEFNISGTCEIENNEHISRLSKSGARETESKEDIIDTVNQISSREIDSNEITIDTVNQIISREIESKEIIVDTISSREIDSKEITIDTVNQISSREIDCKDSSRELNSKEDIEDTVNQISSKEIDYKEITVDTVNQTSSREIDSEEITIEAFNKGSSFETGSKTHTDDLSKDNFSKMDNIEHKVNEFKENSFIQREVIKSSHALSPGSDSISAMDSSMTVNLLPRPEMVRNNIATDEPAIKNELLKPKDHIHHLSESHEGDHFDVDEKKSLRDSIKETSDVAFVTDNQKTIEGMNVPKAARRTKKKALVVSEEEEDMLNLPQPTTRKVLHAPKTSLNPFWSDGEEPSSEEEKDQANAQKPPVPRPRTIGNMTLTTVPEPSPMPRRSMGKFGSVTSLSSLGSSSGLTPVGTGRRKKKPAPPPPSSVPVINKELIPVSAESSRTSSPTPSMQSQSPYSTNRHRKARPAPPPPTKMTSVSDEQKDETSEIILDSLELEKGKNEKDVANRNRQSQVTNMVIAASEDPMRLTIAPNKSTFGQWKRKKGPAPPRPVPQRRQIRAMPMKEVKQELEDIEVQQQGLERQGVKLEQTIRGLMDQQEQGTEGSNHGYVPDTCFTPDVEDLVLQLFELVNEKNELFRRQAELMYLRRQQRLEEEHADLEYQIRCLLECPDHTKTDSDKAREEELIQRLVVVVERRNEIVECLEMDRRREAEEDLSIHTQLGIFAARGKPSEESTTPDSHSKSSSKKDKDKKKHKKNKEKHIKSKTEKRDSDKDVDETEQSLNKPVKEKKNKKRWPHALLVLSLYSGRAQHRSCIRALDLYSSGCYHFCLTKWVILPA